MPKIPSNIIEVGALAIRVYAPDSAGGMCLASAEALTHGGWVIHDGDFHYLGGGHSRPVLAVDSQREVIEHFQKAWKARIE